MMAMRLLPFKTVQYLTAGFLLAFAGALTALEPEPIFDRPTQLSDPSPVLPMTPAPTLDSITLFPDAAESMSLEPEIDKHPWKFVLHGSATATYDDNIFISNANEQEDFIFTIAAGIAVGRGDFNNQLSDLSSYENRFSPDRSELLAGRSFIFLHYVPSVTLFADNSDLDSFNHDVTLQGQYEWKRLTLGIKARFQTQNLPDVDVGGRVERRVFTGVLSSKYDYSEKTSIEANFFNYVRDYLDANRVDSVEYRSQEWVNYQVLPKITLGVGFTYGHVDLSDGPSQDYEQVLARTRYRATEKVQFDLSAGVEFRKVSGFGTKTNPIFSLGVSYAPFDGTSLFLQSYRRAVTSGGTSGVTYLVTGIEGQFRQRFARRYYFVVAVGYQNAEYDFTGGNSGARTDKIFYVHPSVGVDVTKWLSCEIGAEYRQDDSSVSNLGFVETTAYFQVNVFF